MDQPSTQTEPPVSPPRVPVFNGLPAVVLALGLVMAAAHAIDAWSVSRDGMAHGVMLWLGTVRTGEAALVGPPVPLGGFAPYVLHVFVHFGWTHLLLNLGALVAFGAAARRPFGRGLRAELAFLAFFFACAIGGAGLSALVHMGEASTMAGSSTAISGLLAAAGWATGGRAGMLRLALPWLGLNAVIAVIDPFVAIPISWAGHVGGLLVGMAAYPVFVRLARR
jgi:membrane associated rhomboid family serine protease